VKNVEINYPEYDNMGQRKVIAISPQKNNNDPSIGVSCL
jgi:hypothetical protein